MHAVEIELVPGGSVSYNLSVNLYSRDGDYNSDCIALVMLNETGGANE